MALLESAIGGIAVTVLETVLSAGGTAAQQIRGAYNDTQTKQKILAAAKNYEERYRKRHCQVKVMPGLMREPLPLENIYTAVKLLDDNSIRYFVGLDDLEETYRSKGKRSFGPGEAERQDGMKVANEEQYLMVLGGPGIGKSTFLRKIGLEALKKGGQIQRDCIPVLIELKELRGETIDLQRKITEEFQSCGFPEAEIFVEKSLNQGKLLVLLDGLDEVPSKNLNQVIEHIEDFVDVHDNNAFVASCRIAAYRSSQGIFFKRFTDVTLAEFDDDQIEQFIRRWFGSQLDQESQTADRYWELLKREEHKATKELAQTPLLLTFLCLVYDRQQTLPAQRSTLYGKALDILLLEWSAQKRLEQDPIYEGFHPELEKILLAQIAYESFERDQFFFLKEDLLKRINCFLSDMLHAPEYLDSDSILKAIEKQQGILVERATGIYSFSHLTLQEYLSALYIKEEGIEDFLIENHLLTERWKEVFILLSGLKARRSIELLTKIEAKTRSIITRESKLKNLVRLNEKFFGQIQETPEKVNSMIFFLSIVGFVLSANVNIDLSNLSKHRIDFEISCPISIAEINEAVFDVPTSRTILGNNFITSLSIAAKSATAVSLLLEQENSWAENLLGVELIWLTEQERKAFIMPILKASKQFIDGHLDRANVFLESMQNISGAQHDQEKEFKSYSKRIIDHVSSLRQDLKKLGCNPDSWRKWSGCFGDAFWEISSLKKEDLELSSLEITTLTNYFYGLELLIRCRDASVHVPKQAWSELETRLLTI